MKHRLVIYCHEYPPIGGGAGNGLSYLAKAWSARGHEVTVIASGFKDIPKDIRHGHIRVLRLPVGRKSIGQGRIIEMIRYMFQCLWISKKVAKDIRPTLCMAFMTLPAGPPAWLMAKACKIPLITELRGGDVPGFDPKALAKYHVISQGLIHFLWKKSDKVIANSEGLKTLANKTCPDVLIECIPNGVHAQHYAPPEQRNQPDRMRLIYAGRFADSQKNIAALFQVLTRMDTVELILVGDGPDKHMLQKLARNLDIEERVSWLGWLHGEALRSVYHNADIYVSASRWEGMPNAALEAMACGLPLVLSDISGHEDLVVEGRNGYLFSLDDLSQCCAAIEVLRNLSKRQAVGLHGRILALEKYNWENLAEQHLKAFEEKITTHV